MSKIAVSPICAIVVKINIESRLPRNRMADDLETWGAVLMAQALPDLLK